MMRYAALWLQELLLGDSVAGPSVLKALATRSELIISGGDCLARITAVGANLGRHLPPSNSYRVNIFQRWTTLAIFLALAACDFLIVTDCYFHFHR
jgi:hypothetical protein